MTGLETLMWRLGHHDPAFNPTMSLVVRLDGPISLSAVRARVGELIRTVPRLAERVVEPPVPMRPPRWAAAPGFSVDDHVTARPGPLWDVADRAVAEPWDAGRPPWRVVLTSALGRPGELVLHLHHSYTDGLGGVRLITSLFDFHAEGAPTAGASTDASTPASTEAVGAAASDAPAEAVRAAVSDASMEAVRAAVSDAPAGGPPGWFDEVVGEIERAFGLWGRALPWARRTLASAALNPPSVLDPAVEFVTALEGQVRAATGPASPLLSDRSAGVHLVPLELSLTAMRDAGTRIGVTVNDVFVAGLLDGLTRYHAKHGRFSPSLRLAMPISDRRAPDGMHNQILGAALRGPLGPLDLDFAERARLVHEMILLARNQPWAGAIEHLASTAARLPGTVAAMAAGLRSVDVIASNVAGPPAPMWLAGVPVASMTPIGPRSGSAVNATLMSYCDRAAVGLNLDPAAVTSPGVLLDCLVAAFDEALAS
jgi:hypothetical protein